jgi:hypothetical protein
MTRDVDPFREDDAAYVMGALSEEDRLAFEAHLATCADCTASVAQMSAVTSLLGKVPLQRVLQPELHREPPPDLSLPLLLKAARAERRRRSVRLVVAGAAAASVVALALVIGVTQARTPEPAGVSVAMSSVRPAAVTGDLQVTPAAWGTKVTLDCRWVGPTDTADGEKTYRLVAVPRGNGESQVLAQWAVLPGEDATVTGSTDLATSGIARFELRTVADEVLLRAEPPRRARS